jgi:hypothetical protein
MGMTVCRVEGTDRVRLRNGSRFASTDEAQAHEHEEDQR